MLTERSIAVVASSATRRRGGYVKNMWYVYVLENLKNARFYTGVTNDLKRRFTEHNQGRGGKYTKKQGKFKLIF